MADIDTDAVLKLVRSTREMLLPHWGTVEEKRKDGEGTAAVVTELDGRVEQYLKEGLAAIDAEAGFAGEEGGGSRELERFWLCDPIDGTMRFVRGLTGCTVMLARIEHGQPMFSAIYDFVADDLYHAVRGKGAYKNGERIHVSNRPVDQVYVILETNSARPGSDQLRKSIDAVTKVMSSNVAGQEFALVAEGKVEGRLCVKPYGNDYDFAPGAFLVQEAGGIVANIGSRDYDFRNTDIIAATPIAFATLTGGPNAPFPIVS